MRALVTSLAPEITGPRWLGAFLIDEEADIWWVAAFRDGQVFGDRVARGRSLAEELFMSDLEAPDWTSVFAPREWEIPHTKPDKLYEIVDLRIGAPMRSISPIRDNLPRIIMLGLVGAIAVGGYSFYEYKRAEELRELEELRRRAEAGLTISPEDYPWFKSSELSGFIDTCMTEIDRAVLLVPGWESGPISCSIKQGSGSISLGWVRKDGVFTWLRAAVPGDMPAPTLGETGNTASWSFSFDAETNPEALDVEPWAGPLVDSRLRERFQLINHPIALRPSARNQSVATSVPVYQFA